jgi:hypothetical protein
MIRSWRGLLLGGFAALLAGGVAGGYLSFQAWNDNGEFLALAVNALAVLLAVIGALLWSRGHGAARALAVGAGTFFVGALIGAWVAPSAHPPGWSTGSVQLALTVPITATSSGPAECFTTADGSVSVASNDGQTIGADPVIYSVSAPGADRNPGALGFSLSIDPGPGTETRWDSNVEGDAHLLAADGTPASGTLTFSDVSRSTKGPGKEAAETSGGGGFGQSGVVTVSGVVTWTCQPPNGTPTAIEGTWFH